MQQQWWHVATTGIGGVTTQHERVVEFMARQFLDMLAPSNFLCTNPELQDKSMRESGANFVRGFQNFFEDLERTISARKPVGAEVYQVGRNVAVTPGVVVYRNRLIELIQYAPSMEFVHPEPVLIVPAWIMKYYILDLSPQNSLVKYLTDQRFTVFMISWKNPDTDDRDLSLEDYRTLGVMAALDAVNAIVPNQKVHAAGYCLGGTLLAIAAATIAREADDRFQSLTFLAAQIDFEEAGDLMLFINESQVAYLEDMMWAQGFLDSAQMSAAFQMLRSNDLIWSRRLREYLMGERAPMTDLMAWNADGTRLPYRMHSQYLRKLFLNNELAEGHYEVEGRPVTVSDIRTSIFAVGTEWDHVAPWRSVYKLNILVDADVTFLLTSGGHNAGIVSEPNQAGRRYRVATKLEHDIYRDPDTWYADTAPNEGSWWPQWTAWLAAHGADAKARPPAMDTPVDRRASVVSAPGTYVLQA